MSQMIESFMDEQQSPGATRAQPIELDAMDHGSGSGATLLGQPNPLYSVKVRLDVRVGQVTMTIGQLLGAREGDVLALDRAVDHPVDLLLEGKTVARGQLVAVDDCFAVRITELPLPLKF